MAYMHRPQLPGKPRNPQNPPLRGIIGGGISREPGKPPVRHDYDIPEYNTPRQSPSPPFNDNTSREVGDWKSGSYQSGGKTFERDRYNNIVIRDESGTRTWSPGTKEFNTARRALEQAGGNWDDMKAYRPRISNHGAIKYDPSDEYSHRLGQIEDGYTRSLGIGTRPDPYVKPYATVNDLVRSAGNIGSHYGSKIFERQNMDSPEELQLQANQLRRRNAVDEAEEGRRKIDQYADDASSQAYINWRRTQRNLREQNALSGINGGESESSRLAQENQYQSNLNNIMQNRNNQYADIDAQVRNLNNQYDIADAEIRARQEQMRMEIEQRERDRAIQQAMQMANMTMGQERWQKEYELGLENRNYQRGIDARDWDFKQRGYDDSRADAMWERTMAEKKFGMDQRRHDLDMRGRELELSMLQKRAANYGQPRARRSGGRSRGVSNVSLENSYAPVAIDSQEAYIPSPLNTPYKAMQDQYKAVIAHNAGERARKLEADYKAGRITTKEYTQGRQYLSQVLSNFGY